MTMQRLLVTAGLAAALCCARVAAGQAVPSPAAGPGQPLPAEAPFAVSTGPADVERQLTVFCNLEDEACARLVVVLRTVLESGPPDLGVMFRHAAPESHRQSPLAYRAVLAAARQGRGWEMLDMALANRDRLDEAGLRSMAAQLGLDVPRLSADTAVDAVTLVLEDDARAAKQLKVEGVPALFLKGKRLPDEFTCEAILAALKR